MQDKRTVDSLDDLVSFAPDWVDVGARVEDSYPLNATPLRASGAATRCFSLTVSRTPAGTIETREASDQMLLPPGCPQRHINGDGTFCLGLRAGANVSDPNAYVAFWGKLEVFLTCQDTANETGQWPKHLQLSHGEPAALTELEAEKLAAELGLLDEYKNAVYYGTGPIARYATRIDEKSGRVRNRQHRCVCGRKGKDRRLLLRGQCAQANLPCLPVLEKRRREQEAAFWTLLNAQPCCMTMHDCPLRPPLNPPSSAPG